MPKPTLPKRDQAILAAHEAGMHDKHPKPETCRDCAAEARFEAVGKAAIATAPAPIRATAKRARVARTPAGTTVITVNPDGTADVVEPAPVLTIVSTPSHPVCTVCGDPVLTKADAAYHRNLHDPSPVAEPVVESTPVDAEPVTYATREAWMLAAVEAMRPWIEAKGAPVGPVRISFGWPGGRGSKKNVRGQCWMPEAVQDQVPAIFISPAMEREAIPTILGIILHEMNHAAGHFGHTGAFAKTAAALGFLKPWTSSENKDEDLTKRLADLAADLGPLDHAGVNAGNGLKGNGPSAPPVQSTRMLKVWCEADGYTLRTTAKWLSVAIPTCPLCDTEMEVERK